MRREPDPSAGSSATIGGAAPAASRLAAIVFGRETDVDKTIGEFIACAQRDGARVAGLVQEYGDDGGPRGPRYPRARSDQRSAASNHAEPRSRGVRLPRRFRRGRGCRRPGRERDQKRSGPVGRQSIWPSRIRRRRPAGRNRRRRREGRPVVIAVPARYLDAWNAFAGGLDTQLHPASAEIEAWWAAVWPASRLSSRNAVVSGETVPSAPLFLRAVRR